MKCLIWKTPFSLQDRFGFLYTGFFLSGDTKSEENGNVNAKVKTNLLRAELNQRPKDSQHIIYSPPLYQLSYRRIGRHIKHTRNLESLTSWVFWGKSGCFLWWMHQGPYTGSTTLFSETSWRNGSASDSRSEGCVFKSRRGQVISYWREMSNMNGLFLSGDTKSEENGNVNAKVKTNLLRAWIEPAI